MDIKHLRYFVAVAETLSFIRAARELNVVPQSLSTRITELERKLGVRLFDRNTKKVELTTAGETLLPQARELVRGFDAAMDGTRLLSPSQSRRLRIAFSPETSRNVLTDVASRLRQERIEVCLVDAVTAEQQQLLSTGAINIGVLRCLFKKRGYRMSTPLRQPVGVVVDAEHPLAKVDDLRLSDLGPYPLVLFPRVANPGSHDELLDRCRAGGYVPSRILHSARVIPAALRTESAVGLTSEEYFKRCLETETKGVIWKSLEGSSIYKWTSVVCRSDEWVGVTRVAIDVISASLQRHESWGLFPRPVTDRSDKSERTAPISVCHMHSRRQ